MFELWDTYGAPQCGCDVKRFAEWYDVEEFIELHPDVLGRLDECDAYIIERHEPCYLLDTDEYPYYRVVMPDELPGMYRDAIAAGYGDESTFTDWLFDMERHSLITRHD